MTHEVETMAYYGEVPWHGLGVKVDGVMTASEAITAAGLEWEVDVVDIYHNFHGLGFNIPGRAATRRKTDGEILGVVSNRYTPVQNIEAFRFFDDVVGTGEAKYHTAGSLRGGTKIWMLAKLDDSLSIKGDEVEKYMLLMNSHDGSGALRMWFTPIRVVCMNTLSLAEAGAKRGETFYAKHVGDIGGRISKAREILGLSNIFYSKFAEQANRLALLQLPPHELPLLLAEAFGTNGAIKAEDVVNFEDLGTAYRVQEMEKVESLFAGRGRGLEGKNIAGTRWAAYNAVVEYIDYEKNFRGPSAADNRLETAWFNGNAIKSRAWDYLLKV